jgi:serine/threonine-protein kinase
MAGERVPLGAGEVLAGKYRVERVLGRGGMGVVLEATHVELRERRAIKLLLPEALANAELVERFLREGRAAARLRSEHVVRIHDVGRLDGGEPFLVMEHLEGADLRSLLKARGPLPPEETVDYVLEACEAVAEAHALGIVHRDLKPANLFCARAADGSPTIKVLDFGISKARAMASDADEDSGEALTMTKTSEVVGSPTYMAPEQMKSARDADARSDVWALGVILYELSTGQLPFKAPSLPELCALVLTSAPVRPSEHRAGIPAALEEVILRCLEKDPARRFASVAALAAALVPVASAAGRLSVERIRRIAGAPGSAPIEPSADDAAPTQAWEPSASRKPASHPPGALPLGGPAVEGATAASWGRTASGTRVRRGPVVALVIAVPVIAVAVFMFTQTPRPPAAPTAIATPAAIATPTATAIPAATTSATPTTPASATSAAATAAAKPSAKAPTARSVPSPPAAKGGQIGGVGIREDY